VPRPAIVHVVQFRLSPLEWKANTVSLNIRSISVQADGPWDFTFRDALRCSVRSRTLQEMQLLEPYTACSSESA